ncbi:MAG TPA: ABC transporter substrate-binding protein [Candidatus Deferrimicrobiaceae bacterium]|nr:ABC transporter substrate-binding protein [Candidatus Deferrimicrobiaceae bacterium]
MMERRTFLGTLAGGLLAAPLGVEAQPAGKVYRIGMLETRSTVLNAANIEAFRQGLRDLGYKEGENFEIAYRSSDGRDEQFPGLASELVRLQVDLILTRGTPAALAAKSATRTIPVVMAASGDPVGSGLVPSLARPGGNVTGLSSGITESFPKRVELLGELLPGLKRIAAILNMGNAVVPPQWRIVEASARSLGITAHLLDVRRPEDLRGAFDAAAKLRAEALIVGLDGVTQANLRPIAERATQQRLPSIYPAKDYAHVGGLITYGSSDFHMYHRAATFVEKILKGAKPADLPVEQPTKFELVINLKTANALGLTISQSLLVRADEVIQ